MRRKWLKPLKLVSLQAELSKVLRQGMVTDCSQMTFRITVPKIQWLDLPFQKKTGLKILQLSSALKSPPFQWPSKIDKQGHSSEFGYSLSLSLGDSSGPISRNFCCICLSSTHSQAEGLGSVVNLCWPTLLQKAERHGLLCI